MQKRRIDRGNYKYKREWHNTYDLGRKLRLRRLHPQRTTQIQVSRNRLFRRTQNWGGAAAARILHVKRHSDERKLRQLGNLFKMLERLVHRIAQIQIARHAGKKAARWLIDLLSYLGKRLRKRQARMHARLHAPQRIGNLFAQLGTFLFDSASQHNS